MFGSSKQQFKNYPDCLSPDLFIVLWNIPKNAAMTFLFLFGGGLLITLLFVFFIILLPLMALISVLMNDFPGNEKIIWVVIILFLPFLGSVLYFLIGRDKRITR